MKNIPKNILTLHGLWPSFTDGRTMDMCNPGTEVKITDDKSELFISMEKFWMSLIHPNTDFWTHEYNKHGYCYISKYQKTDYKAFFQLTVDMYNKYNFENLITKSFGELTGEHSFEVSDVISKFDKETNGLVFSLDCTVKDGKQYLVEIRFNFDLDFTSRKGYKSQGGNCKNDKPIYLSFL